jgi:hypothetical protein
MVFVFKICNAQVSQMSHMHCHLIINMDKSKLLFFQQSRSIPSTRPLFFCINDKVVVCSVDVKFLGIYTAEDLSWATDTQYVCQKLRLPI